MEGAIEMGEEERFFDPKRRERPLDPELKRPVMVL